MKAQCGGMQAQGAAQAPLQRVVEYGQAAAAKATEQAQAAYECARTLAACQTVPTHGMRIHRAALLQDHCALQLGLSRSWTTQPQAHQKRTLMGLCH